MKKWTWGRVGLTALLPALLALPALAEDAKPGAKPGAQRPGARAFGDGNRFAEMIKKFDTNGDGKLDDAERAAAREAFQKMRAQGGAAPGRPGGPGGPGAFAELLKRFDTNGDGKLDDAERAAAREAFQKMRAQRGAPRRPQGANRPAKPNNEDK
jgi:hypothetical protein